MSKVFMKIFPPVVCFFFLCAASLAVAAHPEVPRISIDELKKMIDGKGAVVVLDVQLADIYAKGHIKGALSFPWKAEITDADTANLPKDKLIVTYCDCGPGEADSSDVASQLLMMGFGNVKVLADPAVRGWKKAGYPME